MSRCDWCCEASRSCGAPPLESRRAARSLMSEPVGLYDYHARCPACGRSRHVSRTDFWRLEKCPRASIPLDVTRRISRESLRGVFSVPEDIDALGEGRNKYRYIPPSSYDLSDTALYHLRHAVADPWSLFVWDNIPYDWASCKSVNARLLASFSLYDSCCPALEVRLVPCRLVLCVFSRRDVGCNVGKGLSGARRAVRVQLPCRNVDCVSNF